MGNLFTDFWEALKEFFTPVFQWLLDVFKSFGDLLAEVFTDLAVTLLELIPVPDFLATPDVLPALPSSVLYLLDIFLVPYGLSLILSAFIARFILRRIPFIG